MNLLVMLASCLFVLGCGDDSKPTAPDDKIVGTWVLVSDSNVPEDALPHVTRVFRSDGLMLEITRVGGLLSPRNFVAEAIWNIDEIYLLYLNEEVHRDGTLESWLRTE